MGFLKARSKTLNCWNFIHKKLCLNQAENGVFVGAIWQQCFPWARSFLNRKKAYYNLRKKERHSHHLLVIIFNYLVHPWRIFTKMVNEIKLMKTKMSQTECPTDKGGQCPKAKVQLYSATWICKQGSVTTSVLYDNRLPKHCSFPFTRLVKKNTKKCSREKV